MAANAAIGITMLMADGSSSRENSRNTVALWPLFTTVSITRSDWVSQITPVNTIRKNPNGLTSSRST